MQDALHKNESDFRDLLKEVDRLRKLLSERDSHIHALGQERQALPSLVEANANSMMLKAAQ